jgi:hypothetical protein
MSKAEPHFAHMLKVLSSAAGVAVHSLDSTTALRTVVHDRTDELNIGTLAVVRAPDGHYMLARYGRQLTSVVAEGLLAGRGIAMPTHLYWAPHRKGA